MNTSITIYIENENEEHEIDVDFDFTVSYTPAKVSGPPEDCYPEDFSSDFEINSIKIDEKSVKLKDVPKDMSNKIYDKVQQWVEEDGLTYAEENNTPPEREYGDDDDYGDPRDDYFYGNDDDYNY